MFYDKPMHIDYAKTKSYATLRREDPNFVPPTSANAGPFVNQNNRVEKRQWDGEAGGDRATKREKGDSEDEEEMEIDEEDESAPKKQSSNISPQTLPASVQHPSTRLLCTNLPQEVTDDVLNVLFQQYQGFQSAKVKWSPAPNEAGDRVKMAQVQFEAPDLAAAAKEALNGFTLKKDWVMTVAFI